MIAGPVTYAGTADPIYPRQTERINDDRTGTPPSISKEEEVCMFPLPTNSWMHVHN